MPDPAPMDTAADGDIIDGQDLQPSIDLLKQTADDLNPLIAASTDADAAQALGRAQQQLLGTAGSLVDVQIDLLAGQAKVTAEHINAAVAYANGVIAAVANWRQRLAKIGGLLDFLSVVFTGNGLQIVQAAVRLKAALDAQAVPT